MEESRNKKAVIALLVIIPVLIATGAAVLICSGMLSGGLDLENVKAGFEDYFDINDHVSDITSEYTDSDGYVDEDDVPDAVQAVGDYAKELYDGKKIQDYQIDKGMSVWIRFNGGMEYVYTPPVAETYTELKKKESSAKASGKSDSTAVSTYQPCLSSYSSKLQELETEYVDGAASIVEDELSDEYKFENNYDNDDVSLDAAANMGTDKVVIWQGHGGYSTATHSFLQTGLKIDKKKYLNNPDSYIESIGYTEDFADGNVILTETWYAAVTYQFFENHLDNMNSIIVYLGACSSGKDNVLANTFLKKGAKAVLANTDTIKTGCNIDMIFSVFDEMTTVSDGKYQTAEAALKKAVSSNKSLHEELGCASDVKIFGDENTRLSDKEVQKEYTAEDLIDKTIPEIIEIMGGDFDVEYGGSGVYYTSPDIIMYNYDVLPGFTFYIGDAMRDYSKGTDIETIRERIKNGDYSFSLLELLNGAKLTDDIDSGMTYNELTPFLGEFDCGGLVSANDYTYATNTVGSETVFLFRDKDGSVYEAFGSDVVTKDWLKKHNPKLNGIVVSPKTTEQPTTAQPTTVQSTTVQPTTAQPATQKQDDSWNQLYIDMINNNTDPSSFSLIKVDNDDIPELIFTGSAVGGTQIAWVSGGELQTQAIGYGSVKYLENQGLLYCDYVNHGIFKDFVFKLENGSLSEVFQGTSGMWSDGSQIDIWSVNGESVGGEEEYNSQLNSAFDFDNAKTPDNSYSRAEIIDAINNY